VAEVKVQSGIGLGMKIALGFFLFSCLVSGGFCAACGGLAVLPSAVSKYDAFRERARDAGAPPAPRKR